MGLINLKIFEKELSLIHDKELAALITTIMSNCDDYNSVGPSSASGKYHAKEDCGYGGNAIHIKKVIYNILKICQCIPKYDSPEEKDILLCSAMLHDMNKYKPGEYSHTVFTHPIDMAALIRKEITLDNITLSAKSKLERIARNVETHMSRWNTDRRYPGVELPTPVNLEQLMLCFSDILAADKNIHLDETSFGNYYANV
jgi:hypothetical protein